MAIAPERTALIGPVGAPIARMARRRKSGDVRVGRDVAVTALAASGAHTSVLTVSLQDASGAERAIAQALKAHRYDGLLTLGGASIAAPTLEALARDRLIGRLTYATFGIGPQVLRAVQAGQITFAADQQPYLQGYLPIVMLTQYRLYAVLPDRGKLVSTGPVFITKRDAGHVLALVNQGVR